MKAFSIRVDAMTNVLRSADFSKSYGHFINCILKIVDWDIKNQNKQTND